MERKTFKKVPMALKAMLLLMLLIYTSTSTCTNGQDGCTTCNANGLDCTTCTLNYNLETTLACKLCDGTGPCSTCSNANCY